MNSQGHSGNTNNGFFAAVALKSSLRLMDVSKLDIISESDWLESTRNVAVSNEYN